MLTSTDEVDKELGCVCLRWCTTDREKHSAVGEDEFSDKTKLNVREQFRVEPSKVIGGALHVVKRSCGISLLSRDLP